MSNDVHRYLLAKIEDAGLKPSPEKSEALASDFVRHAAFLHGFASPSNSLA
jgi:hypothetical protein